MTTYQRILSFSPGLTAAARDERFYPPLKLLGISPRVSLDHQPIDVGYQQLLSRTLFDALRSLGLEETSPTLDRDIHDLIGQLHRRTRKIKENCLRLLAKNPKLAQAGPEWNEKYLSRLSPWGAACIVSNWEEFALPKDVMTRHFGALALLFIDDTLVYLQNRPTQAVSPALLAKECVWLALQSSGKTSSGQLMPHELGGAARSDRSVRVGDYALSLALAGNYRSRAEAVRQIKVRVMEFARDTEGWSISPLQAEKTIGGWLATRGYNPRAS
ncbi:hypothetical protein [Paraburkholderia dioscoreae]|uniref:Uncharacterized protein n=1 Tax=Paraburkholderia dioscoreae TaxID=2604047 RepID=A0A5Q4YW31_9BURK|nr:hypothetical protein [Paraburkholderia dioscoreae]VVD29850.1 protein of unknown function [Paraburkholderia dioscoreae]